MKNVVVRQRPLPFLGTFDPNAPLVAQEFRRDLADDDLVAEALESFQSPKGHLELQLVLIDDLPVQTRLRRTVRRLREAVEQAGGSITSRLPKWLRAISRAKKLQLKLIREKAGPKEGVARNKGGWTIEWKKERFSDEQMVALAAVILENSLETLASDHPQHAAARWEELYWVLTESSEGFSFDNVCAVFGLRAERFREAILAECAFLGAAWDNEARIARIHLSHMLHSLEHRVDYSAEEADRHRFAKERWEALDWISSRSKEPFSFEDCCDLNDIDASEYRDAVISKCGFLRK